MNVTMKKLASLLLCACIITTTLCTSISATDASARDLTQEESLAGVLKTLGLFKGVSDTNFDLGRVPTRTEALVMLVRLLDKAHYIFNSVEQSMIGSRVLIGVIWRE